MSQFRATPQRTQTTSSQTQTAIPSSPSTQPYSQQSSASTDYGTIADEDLDLFSISVSSNGSLPQPLQQHQQKQQPTGYEAEEFDGSDYGELEFDSDGEIEALLSSIDNEAKPQDAPLTGEPFAPSTPVSTLNALATDNEGDISMDDRLDTPAIAIQYEDSSDESSHASFHTAPSEARSPQENPEPRPSPPAAGTPFPEILTKFTSKLKKLSVTDLSSPSWCEQQFVYDLSKHGRKPPTEAMKAGTAVHEKLEQELQQTVTVELKLKEEEWALKLFNAIQALHALRYEGVTREVPVFGIHRNRVIMGIIDEIRMVSPTSVDSAKAEEGFSDVEDNAYPIPLDGSQPSPGVVQLTDHKTRQKNSVPNVTSSAAIPTKIQMMLYSHLLSSLPSLDIDAFCKILSLNPDKPFSDSFLVSLNAIAELSPFPTYSDSSLPQGETYTLETFLSHNSIRGFYSLLRREYPLTIASISPSLRICYRAAQTGHIISNKFIEYSPAFLHHSLESAFDFWEGKRDPVGVGVRDVWKCNFCEFIDTCEWRKKKVDEDIERARQIKAEEEKRRSSYSLEGVTIGEAMRAGGKAFDMKAAMLRETDRPVRVKKKRYEERDWWEGIPGAGPENDETEVVSEAKPVKEIEESVATLYSGVDAAVQTDEVPLPIFAPVATPKTRRRRRTKAEMMAARAAASSPVRGVEREVGVRAGTEEPEGLVVARKRGRPRTKVEEVKVPGRRRGRPRKEVEGA